MQARHHTAFFHVRAARLHPRCVCRPLCNERTYPDVFPHPRRPCAGCFGKNLLGTEARVPLAEVLALTAFVDADNDRYLPQFPALVFSSLFSWVYARPKPHFQRLAAERVKAIRRLCAAKARQRRRSSSSGGSGGGGTRWADGTATGGSSLHRPIDVVVQVRTFRDSNREPSDPYFDQPADAEAFRQCALRGVRDAVARARRDTAAPMCVYVTSDSDAVATDVRRYLASHPSLRAADHADVNVDVVSSAEVAGAAALWHSADVLRRNHALANHSDVAARAGRRTLFVA